MTHAFPTRRSSDIFNRKADGSLEKLPSQHVDTGMGFERLCMAIQKKTSNYDTDVFTPLLHFISQKAGIPYKQAGQTDIAMRVMADRSEEHTYELKSLMRISYDVLCLKKKII